jgi:hypothetical protein
VTNDSDHIVAESVARIFADLADPQTINRLDDGAWKARFWQVLSDAGLPLAWVPERLGGAGASLAEGFAVLGVAGRFAVAVPLAETLLPGWLLTRAGVAAPNGSMTIAPSKPSDHIIFDKDGTLSGPAIRIPFASEAQNIAVLAQGEEGVVVALVAASDCTIGEGQTLAGDPSNIVRFQRVKPLRCARAHARTKVRLRGPSSRCRVARTILQHSTERLAEDGFRPGPIIRSGSGCRTVDAVLAPIRLSSGLFATAP